MFFLFISVWYLSTKWLILLYCCVNFLTVSLCNICLLVDTNCQYSLIRFMFPYYNSFFPYVPYIFHRFSRVFLSVVSPGTLASQPHGLQRLGLPGGGAPERRCGNKTCKETITIYRGYTWILWIYWNENSYLDMIVFSIIIYTAYFRYIRYTPPICISCIKKTTHSEPDAGNPSLLWKVTMDAHHDTAIMGFS